MKIRNATIDDLPALIDVTDQARRALATLGIDQWQGGNPTPQDLANDVEHGWAYLVLDDDGTVLGSCAICDGGEPDYDRLTSGAWLTQSANDTAQGPVRYLVVHRVAVADAATRKGVASAMLAQAASLAREAGLSGVRVDTHHGNLPMQRTLEKAGFIRCCELTITAQIEPTKERVGYELVL